MMSNDPEHGSTTKTRPVEEIRLGAIKAAIWRNETESGVRHNVTFTRLYRQGEDWRSTESFGRDDLLLLAKVADQAHSWILGQGHEAPLTSEATRAAPDPLSDAQLPKARRKSA
jgi:hypothetical protein